MVQHIFRSGQQVAVEEATARNVLCRLCNKKVAAEAVVVLISKSVEEEAAVVHVQVQFWTTRADTSRLGYVVRCRNQRVVDHCQYLRVFQVRIP